MAKQHQVASLPPHHASTIKGKGKALAKAPISPSKIGITNSEEEEEEDKAIFSSDGEDTPLVHQSPSKPKVIHQEKYL